MIKRTVAVLGVATALVVGIFGVLALPIFQPPQEGSEQVVLLHGLGRSAVAMVVLENHLAGAGFEVHNIEYPSLEMTPQEIVEHVRTAVQACCMNAASHLHFVGHSLGGLVSRAVIAQQRPDNLGRVVLLGTPNGGSELADEENRLPAAMTRYAGPAARALGTGPGDFPASLSPPDYPVGVIAGDRGNPVTDHWLPVPNDSMVSVASARLEGMADFVVVDENHAGMRNSKEVARQVVHFLQQGQFLR